MCGIAGTLAYRPESPPVDREELLRMRPSGFDGAGQWCFDNGCIGPTHRCPAIIGVGASGAQPMREEPYGHQIVFNVEICDHTALRADLPRGPLAFARWDAAQSCLALPRDADWAGMAHSLEIRVPVVDMTRLRRVVEIPTLSPAQENRAVAHTESPQLSAAVLDRSKTGFAVPIHQWLEPGAAHTAGNHRGCARMQYRRSAAQERGAA